MSCERPGCSASSRLRIAARVSGLYRAAVPGALARSQSPSACSAATSVGPTGHSVSSRSRVIARGRQGVGGMVRFYGPDPVRRIACIRATWTTEGSACGLT